MPAAEATLGYRLRQYHVGVVCWAGDAAGTVDDITRLDRAISQVAVQAACSGDPLFLPRDESSAWAWLPLGMPLADLLVRQASGRERRDLRTVGQLGPDAAHL